MEEKIVEKVEFCCLAGNQQFLLYPQCFQEPYFQGCFGKVLTH